MVVPVLVALGSGMPRSVKKLFLSSRLGTVKTLLAFAGYAPYFV